MSRVLDDSVLEALVKLAGGDAAFAARVIAAFTAQGEGLCEELRAANEAQDFEQLMQLVHKLGGSAGTVGGDLLRERCHGLESQLRDARPVQTDSEVHGVLECYRATCAALRSRWGGAT